MAFITPPEVMLRPIIRSLGVKGVRSCSTSFNPVGSSFPLTYRAAVCSQLGQPLQVNQLQLPPIKKGQVLISVHSAAVNFADVLRCQGTYQEKAELPFTAGAELAGKVVEVGEGVSNVRQGDHVVAIPGVGGFAEYCQCDSKVVFPIPKSIDLRTAAATLISYGTAMMAITRRAAVKKGETVLVTAAAGATGLAAVDIAAHIIGCTVIGVCGGKDKCRLVEQRGATHTIDYNSENIRDRVQELTKGKGVNVVLDQVGGETFTQCLKSLTLEGRIVTIGYASGKIPSLPANHLLLKSCSVLGLFWGSYAKVNPQAFNQSIKDSLQGVLEGKLHPYIGQEFSLSQVNEAFECLSSRKSSGKVMISIQNQ